ncbi:MAG: FAD-dependent oxidoreductase, partial [Alphaproteobacteria bacterium]|nr:FAD-dependent oxidoreductase [Alphaproteobacteria bacterium]
MAETYDVVVMGTGAAGLSAALSAAVKGARVLVLEKAPVLGGTTAMSGGCIWAPNNHHMARLGVSDSPEAALKYIRAASPDGWHNAEESLWSAFVDQAPVMLKFLEAHSPLRFISNRDPDPYAEMSGGMAMGRNVNAAPLRVAILGDWRDKIRKPTMDIRLNYHEVVDTHFFSNPKKGMLRIFHKLAWRKWVDARVRGNALTVGLLKGCLDQGVELRLNAPVARLTTKDGAVTGLEYDGADGAVEIIATGGVVLASGGFEWNDAMMAEHFPGPLDWRASPSTNTGDGQRMAAEAGARLDYMDQA